MTDRESGAAEMCHDPAVGIRWKAMIVPIALAAATQIVVGCASNGGSHASRPSDTPAITAAKTGSLAIGLLTQSDLDALPELGGLRVAAFGPQDAFVDPDPRGPCGVKVSEPDLQSGAGEVLHLGRVSGANFVVEVPVATAAAYVTALQRDTSPGCPPWQSVTNRGITQTGQLLEQIPLRVDADQSTAAVIKVTVRAGAQIATEVVLRDRGAISLTVIFGTAPQSTVVQALASRAAARLRMVSSQAVGR